MARSLRIEFPGAFYHVTTRGNEQREIFKSQRDREKFLGYLDTATKRYGAVIHAYCLMTNHYHLLVETPAGNLAEIMRHINGAYTTYYMYRDSYHLTLPPPAGVTSYAASSVIVLRSGSPSIKT